jgi:hypothetical protein
MPPEFHIGGLGCAVWFVFKLETTVLYVYPICFFLTYMLAGIVSTAIWGALFRRDV